MTDGSRLRSRGACMPLALGILVATGLAGCASPAPPDAAPLEGVAVLTLDTAPGSLAPGLVAGADGGLYMSWVEPSGEGHRLRYASWTGAGWSAPRDAAAGSDWFVNWADRPSIAALADGSLAAQWLERSGTSTYAYDIVLAVAAAEADGFGAPVRPHDDGTPSEHGFVSLVPGDAGFDVVWLDGRLMAEEPPGPMTLRHAWLGRDGTVSDAIVVDARVCECCPTAAVRTGDGAVVAAWRDRADDELRNILFARLEGSRWSPPQALHDDGWRTGGCPVNGPALDARDRAVVAAWYTEGADDTPRVYAAFSGDAGRSFGEAVRLDSGQPLGRVDAVLLADGSALVSWLEREEGGGAVLLRRVAPDGTADPSRPVARTHVSRSSGYPVLARHGDRTFVAWTEVAEDTTRVRVAALR